MYIVLILLNLMCLGFYFGKEISFFIYMLFKVVFYLFLKGS